jgi:hypothetical protein
MSVESHGILNVSPFSATRRSSLDPEVFEMLHLGVILPHCTPDTPHELNLVVASWMAVILFWKDWNVRQNWQLIYFFTISDHSSFSIFQTSPL